MPKRIVIMAGGTGGHVFPALAVAQYLREQGWQVSWIGTRKGMESRVVPENNIDIDWLSVQGLRGKGRLAFVKMPWMLLRSCLEAKSILRRRKPDVVLGMGGFVSGPGGFMAKLLGIPLVIHEQNRIPGTTNRLLSGFANKVLEAFPDSFCAKKNAIFTGNPLRKAFIENSCRQEQVTDRWHILVLGGSLGAQRLNEVVPEALVGFEHIEVQHQTGALMQQQVMKHYQEKGIRSVVTAFIDDIVSAYAWADLVVCRAGAMTVSELAAMEVASILIPYPYAIDDHQTANAQYLVNAGASVLIRQAELTPETLAKQLQVCLANKNKMAGAAKHCAQLNATERVAEQCQWAAKL